ncbi:MAG: 5-oxoprolinase subunit PxpA [Dehalobacterium sp.]
MLKVDLNADLGESFGAYKIGMDDEVITRITSANIACGWHAGDPAVLGKTIAKAKANGTAIGAHPGYPDLMGFGRRNLSVSPSDMHDYVLYQLGAFFAFAKKYCADIQHLKAHGAMYNMAGKDINLALAICRAVKNFDQSIILLGLAGSKLIEAAEEMGLRSASEVFADRAYEEDGSLVARTKTGAMIHDEDISVARVVKMVRTGYVTTITGKEIPVKADSICIHGDSPKVLTFVEKIRTTLVIEGVDVVNLGSFVK